MTEPKQQLLPGFDWPVAISSVIESGQIKAKAGQLQRDQELLALVIARDENDPDFHWGAEYVDGKLRVTSWKRDWLE